MNTSKYYTGQAGCQYNDEGLRGTKKDVTLYNRFCDLLRRKAQPIGSFLPNPIPYLAFHLLLSSLETRSRNEEFRHLHL